jgi:phenylacetate-CoA ligase
MASISGRVDDMMTVRGMHVFPAAIETMLLRLPQLTAEYRGHVDRPEAGLDEVLVIVEHAHGAYLGSIHELARAVRHR